MLFMSSFQWEPGKTGEILQSRATEKLQPGLKIINEWVALDTNIVFRLVEVEDPVALLKSNWSDLGYVEMHPIMESREAMKYLG